MTWLNAENSLFDGIGKTSPVSLQATGLKIMDDFEKALTLSELEKAAVECARGLSYKASVSGYLIDSLAKNNRLRNDILSGSYKISPYLRFVITEPKRREICATRFRDRVWQKSMCNNGLRDQLLRPLIYDNGACQKRKGVDFAIDRTICFLQRYYRENGTNEGRYDHLDIKGYFPNTPHKETKKVVSRYVKDARIREHVFAIIDSFGDMRPVNEIKADPFGERGTALGSEISQLLQLALPNHIDHAIKERFRIRYYIRFNDDMLLISDNQEKLAEARDYIRREYARIGLEVTIKQKGERLSNGISFLKRRIILTESGKVVVKASPKKIGKERRRLRKLKKKLDKGEITIKQVEEHYQSARAGIARCDEKVRTKSLDMFYKGLFGVDPPRPKRRKKNAYRKSKQGCRKARGRHGADGTGKQEA